METLPPGSHTVPPFFCPVSTDEDILETDLSYQSHHDSLPRTEASATDLTAASEDGASTAIWVQSSPQREAFATNGTRLTQAIDRPHVPETVTSSEVQTKLQKPAAHSALLVGLAAIAAAITTSIVVLGVLPQVSPWLQSIGSDQLPSAQPSAPPAAPSLTSTDATEMYDYANQLMERQQYDVALTFYDRAIALQSDYADAYAGRCEALNRLQRPEGAIVACNDALAYEPNLIRGLWSKGNALMLQNRTYEALKLYESVTELDASFKPGWVKRGVALQRLGRSAEAIDALDQAITLDRNSAEAWSAKGEALFNLQRYDEASIALDKALQLQDPDNSKTVELRQEIREILQR
jgi:eukaryotic-like serine/threonine-protein kinase